MLYIGIPSIAVAAVALTLGVFAGELDPLQLQQAFDAGLLARQDDPNANLNVRVIVVYRWDIGALSNAYMAGWLTVTDYVE